MGPARWRRGRAHALHRVPELPKGIYLFALGKLSSVRRQQVLPSQVRSLLNTGHLTLAFTKHLRPDPALCYSHREDKDGPWAESKIWITAIKIQVSLQFVSPFSCMCFMLSSWTHMCLCPLHMQLETASYKETREWSFAGWAAGTDLDVIEMFPGQHIQMEHFLDTDRPYITQSPAGHCKCFESIRHLTRACAAPEQKRNLISQLNVLQQFFNCVENKGLQGKQLSLLRK